MVIECPDPATCQQIAERQIELVTSGVEVTVTGIVAAMLVYHIWRYWSMEVAGDS